MLHGTGGNEQEFSALAGALDPAAGVLATRGRVQENGMNRWFRRLSEGVFDTADVARQAGDLAAFVSWAREHYALGDRPLIAVGFSNGANIALATALLHPEVLPRVIAFSGMQPLDGAQSAGIAEGSLTASALLLVNGRSDPMAPLASADELALLFESRGAAVTRELRPGGHGIAESDVEAAVAWLTSTS